MMFHGASHVWHLWKRSAVSLGDTWAFNFNVKSCKIYTWAVVGGSVLKQNVRKLRQSESNRSGVLWDCHSCFVLFSLSELNSPSRGYIVEYCVNTIKIPVEFFVTKSEASGPLQNGFWLPFCAKIWPWALPSCKWTPPGTGILHWKCEFVTLQSRPFCRSLEG